MSRVDREEQAESVEFQYTTIRAAGHGTGRDEGWVAHTPVSGPAFCQAWSPHGSSPRDRRTCQSSGTVSPETKVRRLLTGTQGRTWHMPARCVYPHTLRYSNIAVYVGVLALFAAAWLCPTEDGQWESYHRSIGTGNADTVVTGPKAKISFSLARHQRLSSWYTATPHSHSPLQQKPSLACYQCDFTLSSTLFVRNVIVKMQCGIYPGLDIRIEKRRWVKGT